jgi:hypothetical protein
MKILPIFFSLILITYGLIGIIQVVAGLFAYFLIMTENGFLPSCLFDLKKSWESKDVNNLQNSYGQEWVRISPFILLKENLFLRLTNNVNNSNLHATLLSLSLLSFANGLH